MNAHTLTAPEGFWPRPTFGIGLPHYGRPTRTGITDAAILAESLGFDALWVRDHLGAPADLRKEPGTAFIEAVVALAVAASHTERICLGLAAMTPHRNPVHAAAVLSSIDYIAGPNRLIVGIGLGSSGAEAAAAGMSGWDRRAVVEEYVTAIRSQWRGEESHHGSFYDYDGVGIRPLPRQGNLWVSYCGTSRAAVRRAVEYCESWGPAKLPLWLFEQYVGRMEKLRVAAGRDPLPAAASSLVAFAESAGEAVAQMDLAARLAHAQKVFPPPPGGRYQTAEDLYGMVLAGTPDRIAEGAIGYFTAGASHFVFDLRNQFDTWEDQARRIADEVIPLVRKAVPGPQPRAS